MRTSLALSRSSSVPGLAVPLCLKTRLFTMSDSAYKEPDANVTDEEKGLPGPGKDADVEVAQSWSLKKFASLGVETGGIVPIPLTERTNTRIHGMFTLWLTMSVNLLP